MTIEAPQPKSFDRMTDFEIRVVLRWLFRFALALLIAYAVYKFFYPTYSWNQKTTVTVLTPEGPRSGTSTVRVSWRATPSILPDARDTLYEVSGEATIVDLGAGRYLFTLLPGAESLGLQVFAEAKVPSNLPKATLMDAAREVAWSAGETRELKPDQFPQMVTFEDIDDPKSARLVDPANLAATFGKGYRLGEITMSISPQPPTGGEVEKVLSWWCEYRTRRARLNGSTSIAIFTNELADVLGTGAFRIGDCT